MKHKVLLFISLNAKRDKYEIQELLDSNNYKFCGTHNDGTVSFELEYESSIKMSVGEFFFDDALSFKITRVAYIIDFNDNFEGVSYMCDYIPENLV